MDLFFKHFIILLFFLYISNKIISLNESNSFSIASKNKNYLTIEDS